MEDKKKFERVSTTPNKVIEEPMKDKNSKQLKGKSATGKPLEPIIINPQQNTVTRNEDYRGLTRAAQVARRQSIARLAEKLELNDLVKDRFVDLRNTENTSLIRVIENTINQYKSNGDPLAALLEKAMADILPRDVITEALVKKSNKSGIALSTLSEVYNRGVARWTGGNMTCEQSAFGRVNSYIAQGKAYELDLDLRENLTVNEDFGVKHPAEDKVAEGLKRGLGRTTYSSPVTGLRHEINHSGEHYRAGMMRGKTISNLLHIIDKTVTGRKLREEVQINEDLDSKFASLLEKRGLWDNIRAKRKRIKGGSGERMRKPGSAGAPSTQDFKDSQTNEQTLDAAYSAMESVRTDDYKNSVVAGYSKTSIDPKTGKLTVTRVPAHYTKTKTSQSIIKSGNVHDGNAE